MADGTTGDLAIPTDQAIAALTERQHRARLAP
jgi:hypothetical protein